VSITTSTGALRARWSVFMVLVGAVLVAGSGYVYTNHVQRETLHRTEQIQRDSDRRWCALLAKLDQPAPATSERGREIQRQIHQLRLDLGCVKP
jgi:hypothetical protein